MQSMIVRKTFPVCPDHWHETNPVLQQPFNRAKRPLLIRSRTVLSDKRHFHLHYNRPPKLIPNYEPLNGSKKVQKHRSVSVQKQPLVNRIIPVGYSESDDTQTYETSPS